MIAFLKSQVFVLALFGVVLLAFVAPGLGAPEGPLKTPLTTQLGIMVIFLLQGLSLRTRELLRGLGDLRVTLLTQASIYLIAPVVMGSIWAVLRMSGFSTVADGFLYLALLPTTVTSAVALTTAAGGNAPAALFNCTLANVLGVFWVPVMAVLVFAASGEATQLIGPLLWKLTYLILIPLLIGQIIRPFVAEVRFYQQIRPHFTKINNSIVLYIVFAAFSRSVLNDSWSGRDPVVLIVVLVGTITALLAMHGLNWQLSGFFLKDRSTRITVLFCGSQKTLAAGVPMGLALFGQGELASQNEVSLLLLPLMLYHPLQLFLAAILIPRLQKKAIDETKPAASTKPSGG